MRLKASLLVFLFALSFASFSFATGSFPPEISDDSEHMQWFIAEFGGEDASEAAESTQNSGAVSVGKKGESIHGIRRRAYRLLVDRCNKCLNGNCVNIPWKDVEITGLPAIIRCTNPHNWHPLELDAFFQNSDNVYFKFKPANPKGNTVSGSSEIRANGNIYLELKEALSKLHLISSKRSPIDWQRVNRFAPNLFLSTRKALKWTSADRRALKQYIIEPASQLSLDPEQSAQFSREPSEPVQQSSGPSVRARKSYPRVSAELKAAREEAYRALLKKYYECFGYSFSDKSARNIKWSEVEVIGWPAGIRSKAQDWWSMKDAQEIVERIDSISFKRIGNPGFNPTDLNSQLYQELRDIAAQVGLCSAFRSLHVNWKKLHAKFPQLTLAEDNFKYWNRLDREYVKTVLIDDLLQKELQNIRQTMAIV